MATDRERRLAVVEQTPLPPGSTPLSPEVEQFLSALTMNTLKWLNRQYWHRPDLGDDAAAVAVLKSEVERLNDMDRRGLLADGWWCELRSAVVSGGDDEPS